MSDDEPAGTTVSTTSSEPWSGQQPYLTEGFEGAQGLLNTPREFYPGDMTVPFSQQTEAALVSQEGRALQGSDLAAAGQGQMQDVLAGDYLNGNPAFEAMGDRVYNSIRPGIDAQFAGAGRYGGAGHEEMMTRTYNDMMAPLAYQNYEAERKNQMAAGAASGEMAQQDYYDMGRLGEVGAAREGLATQQLSQDVDRYNFSQDEPRNRLQEYMTLIKGGNFKNTTTSTPYYSNSGMNALGAAATGVGILDKVGGWF